MPVFIVVINILLSPIYDSYVYNLVLYLDRYGECHALVFDVEDTYVCVNASVTISGCIFLYHLIYM